MERIFQDLQHLWYNLWAQNVETLSLENYLISKQEGALTHAQDIVDSVGSYSMLQYTADGGGCNVGGKYFSNSLKQVQYRSSWISD
jgi:hypothetical protein